MQFKWHSLIGFVASYILVYFFNFSLFAGLIIFLSSWLIDIDHYIWYGIETKDWNPFHAINWYKNSLLKIPFLSKSEKNQFKRGIFIFHEITFWIIIITLSFYYKIFLWILIGIIIHIIADWTELIILKEPIYNKMFLYFILKRNKGKKSLREL